MQWDCPFPEEADDAGVDHAVVTLRVEVGGDGTVQSVRATSDPGHGFAREARRCAMSKRWSAGLDRAGNPANAVALVNVRFDR
jgi:outer membrane biosynthesis protein TonB